MKKYMPVAAIFLLASASAWADGQNINIKDHQFLPDNITIAAGTNVTWVNRDQDPHTVVGRDNSFRSGALDTNDRYSYRFTAPGTYKYFCSLHPAMQGMITVK